MKSGHVRFSIELSDSEYARIKRICEEDRTSIRLFIETAIVERCERRESERRAAHARARTEYEMERRQ